MKTLALVLAALAASAALAQQAPPAVAQRSARHGEFDPNQMICRSEAEPGSRLHGHRTCLTRAQWADRTRLDRQYAEKAQTNRTYCGGICTRRMNHGR